jgi:hypothetical protein
MRTLLVGLWSCLPEKIQIIQPEYLYDAIGKISTIDCSFPGLNTGKIDSTKEARIENYS